MKALPILLVIASLAPLTASAQFKGTPPANPPAPKQTPAPAPTAEDIRRADKLKELQSDRAAISRAEREGVGVRLDALCHFRGLWTQQLLGIGLVTGLDGTGDSSSYTATQLAAGSLLRQYGIAVDTTPSNFQAKNIALVTVTCDLPPYSTPGQQLDVMVSAMGDSKSLRNGTLLFTPLKYPGQDKAYATASGPISVGGYSASSHGSSAIKGFVTVGKIPNGAQVVEGVPTNTVFNGKMYLDLDTEDVTTAQRIEQKIQETYPELAAHALGAGTIEITVPSSQEPSLVQSHLLQLVVQANTEAKVTVDERTGTIIVGGNVRIAACAIARGSISVQVSEDLGLPNLPLAAPNPSGTTNVSTTEEAAQITTLRPNTTVQDLAEIFQALHLHADDIIAILENLRDQGALKGKLEIK